MHKWLFLGNSQAINSEGVQYLRCVCPVYLCVCVSSHVIPPNPTCWMSTWSLTHMMMSAGWRLLISISMEVSLSPTHSKECLHLSCEFYIIKRFFHLKSVHVFMCADRNDIQHAGVQYILDSVVDQLLKNPDRRFIYVETAFFYRWWKQQSSSMQQTVKQLVNEGT